MIDRDSAVLLLILYPTQYLVLKLPHSEIVESVQTANCCFIECKVRKKQIIQEIIIYKITELLTFYSFVSFGISQQKLLGIWLVPQKYNRTEQF